MEAGPAMPVVDPELSMLPATRVAGPPLPLHLEIDEFAAMAVSDGFPPGHWQDRWASPAMTRWLEAADLGREVACETA